MFSFIFWEMLHVQTHNLLVKMYIFRALYSYFCIELCSDSEMAFLVYMSVFQSTILESVTFVVSGFSSGSVVFCLLCIDCRLTDCTVYLSWKLEVFWLNRSLIPINLFLCSWGKLFFFLFFSTDSLICVYINDNRSPSWLTKQDFIIPFPCSTFSDILQGDYSRKR